MNHLDKILKRIEKERASLSTVPDHDYAVKDTLRLLADLEKAVRALTEVVEEGDQTARFNAEAVLEEIAGRE